MIDPVRAVDDDSNTRWATDDGVGECWLEVDLGAGREFDGVYLSEGWDRVRSFVLECRDEPGRPWRPFYRGATIGTAGLTASSRRPKAGTSSSTSLEAAGGP